MTRWESLHCQSHVEFVRRAASGLSAVFVIVYFDHEASLKHLICIKLKAKVVQLLGYLFRFVWQTKAILAGFDI